MTDKNRSYHNDDKRSSGTIRDINDLEEAYDDSKNYQYYQTPKYANEYQDYSDKYDVDYPINKEYDERGVVPKYITPDQSMYDFPYEDQNYQNFKNEEKTVKNGKVKTGRRKIEMCKIPQRNRRSVTFSKRKKGLMKKAYELNILTGTEILLLVASESGHVYTFATPKLKPIISKHENLIQQCLNAPAPDSGSKRYNLEEELNYGRLDSNMPSEYYDEYEQMYRQNFPPRRE